LVKIELFHRNKKILFLVRNNYSWYLRWLCCSMWWSITCWWSNTWS
jgi:hypothetical protein